jgi:Holliday junction resolvasome RuvABC endonuclease subunit
MSPSNFRVLGCDPGKVNFAWAIYGDEGLEDHGLIEGAEAIDRLDYNAAHFEKIIRYYDPDVCCIERFHQRPGKGSVKNMELVNLMIGQARMICRMYQIPCMLVTASTHKKWTSQNFDVARVKTKARSSGVGKKFDLTTYQEWRTLPTDHEVDAANVAKYAHDHAMTEYREEE